LYGDKESDKLAIESGNKQKRKNHLRDAEKSIKSLDRRI
jgi:hypothetical protein